MSFARAQAPPRENQQLRVTKKVKSRNEEDVHEEEMVEVATESSSQSFKEALLNIPGISGEFSEEEDWEDDGDLPENRWYKEQVDTSMIIVGNGVVPEIHVTDEELENWSKPWRHTLVINVLGKKVSFRALVFKLNRDWAMVGTIKIIDMPRGFYAVQFNAKQDYTNALCGGPWMIADHYILVQRWRRNFLKSATSEHKVVVWVRIPELPLELYNEEFLTRLGAGLGGLLKIDGLTSFQCRGQFARICIEMDLAKLVVPQVVVRGKPLI